MSWWWQFVFVWLLFCFILLSNGIRGKRDYLVSVSIYRELFLYNLYKKYNSKFWNSDSIWILEGCETWEHRGWGLWEDLVLLWEVRPAERIHILPRSVRKETSPTCCSNSFYLHAPGTLLRSVSPSGVSLVWAASQVWPFSEKKFKEKSHLEMCHYVEHWLRKWAEII